MRLTYTEVLDQGAAQQRDPEGMGEERERGVHCQKNRADGADGVDAGRGAGAEAKDAGEGVESGVEGGGHGGAWSGLLAEDMYMVGFEGSVGQGVCANA